MSEENEDVDICRCKGTVICFRCMTSCEYILPFICSDTSTYFELVREEGVVKGGFMSDRLNCCVCKEEKVYCFCMHSTILESFQVIFPEYYEMISKDLPYRILKTDTVPIYRAKICRVCFKDILPKLEIDGMFIRRKAKLPTKSARK